MVVIQVKFHTFGVGEVRVLQDLRKQEALLVVVLGATIGSVNVREGSKARVGTAGFVDGNKGIPDPVAVLYIGSVNPMHCSSGHWATDDFFSGDSVRVVKALDNLGSQNVRPTVDVETRLLIQVFLAAWYLFRVPSPGIRTNLGQR